MTKNRFVMTALVLGLAAAPALASPPEFSADTTMVAKGQTVSGKIFVSNDKSRVETPQGIRIVRKDLQTSYLLQPEQKTYMQFPVSFSPFSEDESSRVSLGAEEVNGTTLDKFKGVFQSPKGPVAYYQWETSEGIPVMKEAEDKSWGVEYKNVQTGSQPAELFEIPPDYQKAETPSGPGSPQ